MIITQSTDLYKGKGKGRTLV